MKTRNTIFSVWIAFVLCTSIRAHNLTELYNSSTALTPKKINLIIQELLDQGINLEASANLIRNSRININIINTEGKTALHLAAVKNNTNIIKVLILAGININATINNPEAPIHGWTALHLAVIFENIEAINAIFIASTDPIQRVAFINATINNPEVPTHGWTALHLAVAKGYTNVINALIDAIEDLEQKAAFVNATINNPEAPFHGWAALHLAINKTHVNTIHIHTLFKNGAKIFTDLLPCLYKLGITIS